jgi:hypothetical protein
MHVIACKCLKASKTSENCHGHHLHAADEYTPTRTMTKRDGGYVGEKDRDPPVPSSGFGGLEPRAVLSLVSALGCQ